MKKFEGIPVFLILTTHVADERRDNRVETRNTIVCEIAKRYGLSVIDFYTDSRKHSDLLSADGV